MRTARSLLYGGVLSRGGSLSSGFCVHGGLWPGDSLPPVDRMTGACENITLPRLRLWAVKSSLVFFLSSETIVIR